MSSFFQLEPEYILKAIEKAGYRPTGQLQQLNSYENRVFDLYLENEDLNRVIAKFYRPNRWSKNQILEEHEFLFDLKHEGIPAVAPLKLQNGSSLMQNEDMYYCLFPRHQGRMPDELLAKDLASVGRSLALLHNLGEQKKIRHRPTLNTKYFGDNNLEILQNWIQPQLWSRYEEAAEYILDTYDDFSEGINFQRIHGDCHKGNLLHDGSTFFMVDFDDFISGPVAQDFWMLIADTEEYEKQNLEYLLSGYEELRSFNYEEIKLFPLLKALRIINYAAWIAKRWQDPSFPQIFPEFNTYNYWAEEVENLEKIAWSF